jgi:deazaflavin-dependent oxidoreductase (nitroreductase family)
MTQAPTLIRLSNPIARSLLRLGMPMGPNTLLTVRGRKSGEPRSAPVAIVEIDGRRWTMGAYGEVHWVRNLRAAGEGEIRLHGQDVHVDAHELTQAEAETFYGETLRGYVAKLPAVARLFARMLFSAAGPEVLDDPQKAALRHPVFELTAAPADPGAVIAQDATR